MEKCSESFKIQKNGKIKKKLPFSVADLSRVIGSKPEKKEIIEVVFTQREQFMYIQCLCAFVSELIQ